MKEIVLDPKDNSGLVYCKGWIGDCIVNTPKNTAIHELMHAHEDSYAPINDLAWDFLSNRTTDDMVQLSKICKEWGYNKDEDAYLDNFFDPYVGKNTTIVMQLR